MHLAPNAATQIDSVTPSSPVTVTALAHTPDGFGFNTQVMSVTFTPAQSGLAQAFVDARASYAADALGPGYAVWSIQDVGGAFDGWKKMGSLAIPASTSATFPISTTRSTPVVGGVTYTFALYVNKFKAGDTLTIDNMQMRVETVMR